MSRYHRIGIPPWVYFALTGVALVFVLLRELVRAVTGW